MTLGERLKLVRGAASQRAFAAELSLHENTVSNAERRNSATQEYLLKLAEARNINLHWLLTGHGPMRIGEADGLPDFSGQIGGRPRQPRHPGRTGRAAGPRSTAFSMLTSRAWRRITTAPAR